jgi:hypothetical protein
MKATKAYIASLGTTGVLLGASLLMLAIVSAVVAFNRWPSGTVSTRVPTLVIDERAAPIRVNLGASAAARAAALAAAGRGLVPGGTGVLRGVAGERFASGHTGTPATGNPVPAIPSPPLPPLPSSPIDIGRPDRVPSQLADQAQAVTNSAGAAAAAVSPPAGQAVAGGGQTAADTMRMLPLPSLTP